MQHRYQAVLFDFDGVLADTEPIHRLCWAGVLQPYGIDLDWDTYVRHCVGVSDRDMLAFLSTLADPPVELDRLIAEYPRKKELFRERTRAESPVPAATRELVRELAPHYKLAVVSSSGRQEIEPLIESAGIRDCFTALVCGDDVTRFKPDPEPYRLAGERLSVERALVVEDSDAGCASGQAAGFDVLRVPSAAQTASLVRERMHLPARF
jgi:HAD superfamily hydrolase (TIGR01509 family)